MWVFGGGSQETARAGMPAIGMPRQDMFPIPLCGAWSQERLNLGESCVKCPLLYMLL